MTVTALSAAAFAFRIRLNTVAVPLVCSQPSTCHVRDAFSASWLSSLELPVGRVPVTLIDGAVFQRVSADDAAVALPRTRSYENLHVHVDWIRLASRSIELALGRRVTCAAYASQAGYSSLGRHYDDWDGVIVQLEGAKRWRVWTASEDGPTEMVTRVGDVLVLPRGVPHDVDTPERSLHLAFAVTNQPVEPPAARR
ncbi:Cupin superfamily protein [Streptomyces noursei ATCC 11455]|nr:Cupin superfamily protein [Streptomyces noursei ATCC 11455]ANZ21887.1 Cupin superfamily protein [Streptomyces noursei ATCC 11455]